MLPPRVSALQVHASTVEQCRVRQRCAGDLDPELASVSERCHRHAESAPKPLGGDRSSFRGLPRGRTKALLPAQSHPTPLRVSVVQVQAAMVVE